MHTVTVENSKGQIIHKWECLSVHSFNPSNKEVHLTLSLNLPSLRERIDKILCCQYPGLTLDQIMAEIEGEK